MTLGYLVLAYIRPDYFSKKRQLLDPETGTEQQPPLASADVVAKLEEEPRRKTSITSDPAS